ncbi:OLC1v1006240C1 [Oldenlandia corymbosa var. corymbosa]|uniref:OLC1v1006240C1 n=1 Tax=Oldenlandia corymbosa var. corymbosa TaxID=529605 RepID=A0AAV1DH54_OLDCO|nr:OLC1v1006240C1 [Oldenlandia corymbosa var. corymbosa]
MPTPVSSARQCLTEEAARALDDAVNVAKRRSHAQTTSLHAVSALLALPSSALREACSRARSSAYSPRLQFKALELCVGVSLDRLPTTKAQDEPPISNSLMAAIKRSQANQRRHPETFHLYQQLQHQSNINSSNGNSSPPSISAVKVELKHFILSILDDPIVSRVFGEAGFRSYELKIAILNPPTISRFSKTRCPPLFLCNLSDLESGKRGFSFPFPGVLGSESLDENSRRIGEVLVQKTARNPLLVGVCAKDALNGFTDDVKKGKAGVLPREIDGLCTVCLEKDISDFLLDGGRNEEMIRLKFLEIDKIVEASQGAGVVVNFGDLKVFVDAGESVEAVKFVVSQLSRLVQVHGGKLWLIGSAASFDTYMNFSTQFPTTEKDWDLHLMPITSSKSPGAGVSSRSSLMGSFVPFGGFFPTPSDFDSSWSNRNQFPARCTTCNEKYEQEASALRGGSRVSVADQYSANLSPWLQMTESDKKKSLSIPEARDDSRALLNTRLMALETKWNDICQRIHRNCSLEQNVLHSRPQYQNTNVLQLASARSGSAITDTLIDERKPPDHSSCMPSDSRSTSLSRLNVSKPFPQEPSAGSLVESPLQRLKMGNFWNSPYAPEPINSRNQKSPVSVTSVTTDLGLGTLYASGLKEPSNPKLHQAYNDRFQNSGSVSADASSENASNHVTQSSACSVPPLREQPDEKDFKYIWKVLSEKVNWQDEAVLSLSQIVASCRSGYGQRRGPNKGNIWLSLLGPDKVGKRRIAAGLAEALFGCSQRLLRIDLGSLGEIGCSDTIISREDLRDFGGNFRRKTPVDYVAEELSKKSETVILVENVDKADIQVQTSLSQALKTGKFPNSYGREVSINNKVFVITSSASKGFKDFFSGNLCTEYSEERVLAARDMRMQVQVGCASRDAVRYQNTNLKITSNKRSTTPLSSVKRKYGDDSESVENRMLPVSKRICETSRSSFDLNLPVEDTDEDDECNNSDSDSGSGSSKAWLEEFLDQVDGNVVLKPFDFDALAHKILKEINLSFQEVVGSTYFLEMESETVVQMLAAAWISEREGAVENWIQDVLRRSFEETSRRCSLAPDKVMKLTACGGAVVEDDHSPGICLPSRILTT